MPYPVVWVHVIHFRLILVLLEPAMLSGQMCLDVLVEQKLAENVNLAAHKLTMKAEYKHDKKSRKFM